MKILVLGGTGAMGVHLVSQLECQRHNIVVTSRTRSGHDGNIEYVTGNAKDMCFMLELLKQNWDVIVDFMVYSTGAFKERYRQLLNATDHYIYISSSRVYADSELPITESSPRLLDVTTDQNYLATSEYALSKARQENLLFDSEVKNWSIIRPYITYSDERLQLGVLEKEDWLYRALKGRTIVASSDIQNRYTTLTFGEDVARGIVAILGQPNALGEAFHITADEVISWADVMDTYVGVIEEHMRNKPTVVLQELDKFMGWRTGKYQVIYDRLYDRRFDNSKISQYVDVRSFQAPQSGLAQCLERFIKTSNPYFNSINWREEAVKDRLLKEHTPFKDITGFKQKVKYYLFRNIPLVLIQQWYKL